VWHCVEDAGLKIGTLAGKPVGVFFGAQVNEYGAIVPDRDVARAQIALGNIATMLPNRISYLFDLRGPSEAVDTACSSSMVAVHRAVRALQAGECDMALAGGVSLVLTAESIVSTAELGVVSPDGRCHTFDARANGYVKGEGVGVVLLKPLAKAQADGDPIHAVILASAANHGGRAHSLTAPNGTAQAALVAAAIRQAGVASDTIGYVEAHGTGTELGDPVEVMALKEGFAATAAPGSVQRRDCRLGTVKTNIGHLEPASGIAGLIKTVLALKHRTLPASLHFQQLNPLIDFSGTAFSVVDRTRPWEPLRDGEGRVLPRRAGVSSFGLGGSNVHLVLQENAAVADAAAAPKPELLMVSARDQDRLTDLLCRLAEFAGREPAVAVADIAHTLAVGREPMAARAAVLWRPGQSLAERLQLAAEASAGTAEPDDIWIGTVARAALGRDDAAGARQFLADLLASGQLGRLGALWVVGTELPKQVTSGRRVSLPGYPFAQTRYWCDREVSAPSLPPPAPAPASVAARPPVAPPAPGRAVAEVRAVVRRHLAQALYLEEAQLDERAGFADLGLDSILAVELTKSLNDALGTQLQATRLYDYANVVELAAYLHESLSQPAEAPSADPLSSPGVAFLMEQLAAIGATGLSARTPLEAIGLQPAQAKSILGGLNERFGCGLSEADIGRCPDLGRLATLIETRTASVAPDPSVADYRPTSPRSAQGGTAFLPGEAGEVPRRGGGVMGLTDAAARDTEVAIIGYACRLPGAPDAAAFWERLCSGEVAVTPYPAEPWRRAEYEQALRSVGSDATPWGGYLDEVDRFDPAFFNIPADQARAMDPQQRLFLQVAWHALEMAGQTRAMLDGAECGVFVGGGPSDYGRVLEAQAASVDGQTLLGNISSIMAARIAYFLNLRGPCVAMDTACSSGLVALHAAWRSILDGECESAIVGGVSLLLTPQMHVLTGAGGMLSAAGRCQTFDDAADGFVPAEGIVALVLKRLDRALADGDPIHGVVRGAGINQNGTTAGIAAPSARAQARLLGRLYDDCRIAAPEIGLVEVHGTGTKIGDALEFDALRQVFGAAGVPAGATVLSSAKPVIGHSFAASGLASVVKLLLALRHRRIPPTRAPQRLNQHMRLQDSPFRIGTALEAWPAPAGGRRLAAATSYGLSGTNAHVVLAEAPETTGAAARRDRHLVVVSARDADALKRQLGALRAAIAHDAPPLGDLAYTLAARRNPFAARAAFVVRDLADLSAQLARGPGALPADAPAALRSAAEAWLAGGEVDWTALYPHGRVCDLPGYRFAADRYWPGAAPPAAVASATEVPESGGTIGRLSAIFAQVLRADVSVVTPDTPFDVMGLDSAAAVEIMKTAEAAFAVALPVIALWDHPTIRSLAGFVDIQPPADTAKADSLAWAGRTADGRHDPVVPIRADGDGQPSFWVHGGPGDVNWVVELARHLPADRPVYGLEAAGLDGIEPPLPTVEAMAAHYVEAVLRTQPNGPYRLGGYSGGGAIAFEMARQMLQAGHAVERLVLLDCNAPGNTAVAGMQAAYGPGYVYLVVGNWFGARWGTTRPLVLADLAGREKPAMLEHVIDHLFAHARPPMPRAEMRRHLEALDRIGWSVGDALRAYRAEPIAVPLEVLLFECRDGMAGGANPLGLPADAAGETYRDGWDALFATPVTRIAVACDHFALLKGEAGRMVASHLVDDGRAKVAEVVLGLVREILPDAPPELVAPERSMAELGATSIDRVEVATLAMESLGLKVPNSELASVSSIGDLIDVLHRHASPG